MSDEMTPEKATALLEAHASVDPRDVVERFISAPSVVRVPVYFMLDGLPDLARAYLAAHERAERAEEQLQQQLRMRSLERTEAASERASRLIAEARAERMRAVVEAARQRDGCDELCFYMQPYRGCTCGDAAMSAALTALDALEEET